MTKFRVTILSSILLLIGAFANAAPSGVPMKVRWLIAHEPADAFRRAAVTFSAQLARESKGEMVLEVLTPKDFGSTTGNMDVSQIFAMLKKGDIELSQTLTTGIGGIEPQFFVLDLPFLFKSHKHATKVLDGKIGANLFASLERTDVHGLAFTYSGGFRVIPSSKTAINSPTDFKGMRVRTTNSPVAQETLRVLGAVPVPLHIDASKNALETNQVDAVETTYIRIDSVAGKNTKYINDTHHSLFLTSILASSKFFNSLSAKNQDVLKRAALAAAKIEREDSIADGEKLKVAYQKKGVQVINMPSVEMAKMEEQVQPVYQKFETMFGKKLIEDIVAQK